MCVPARMDSSTYERPSGFFGRFFSFFRGSFEVNFDELVAVTIVGPLLLAEACGVAVLLAAAAAFGNAAAFDGTPFCASSLGRVVGVSLNALVCELSGDLISAAIRRPSSSSI